MTDPVTSPDTEKSSSKSTPIIGLQLNGQQQEPKTRIRPTPLIELLRMQEAAMRRVLQPKPCPRCGWHGWPCLCVPL